MNRVLATDLQHVAGVPLPAITDEVMHERLRAARPYTVVLLRATGKLARPERAGANGSKVVIVRDVLRRRRAERDLGGREELREILRLELAQERVRADREPVQPRRPLLVRVPLAQRCAPTTAHEHARQRRTPADPPTTLSWTGAHAADRHTHISPR
jgi:hypothetical protein